jgi:DNA-3-methyladenine glycosylase II
MSEEPSEFAKARRYLSRRDAVLRKLIKRVGPCTLCPNPDRFGVLVRSIVSQQISGKAAASISARLLQAAGKRGLHPKALDALDDAAFRAAGLSAGKVKAIRDLTAKVLGRTVHLDDLHERDDEEVVQHLLPVHGIGRWTAEMFLIFCLGRLDVLPLADLGLRVGVQKQHGLAEIPDKAQLIALGDAWRPYRTIATWYIWRSFGPVTQS